MYTTYSDEGNIIQIGRNQYENEYLVKNSNLEWVWFHTKKGSSPHGIIQTDSPNVDLIPAHIDLVAIEIEFSRYMSIQF